jgi:histidine triad (HIT) family protein
MVEAGDCVLCRVVDGELPSMKVYEDESFLGILDVSPRAEGHCLVVPKEHVTRFYDMGDEELAHLFRVVKVVARRVRQAFNPDFVCVFIRGGRISHLHVAVFPSAQGDPLSGFPQSSLGTAIVDLPSVAARLSAAETV